MTREGAERIDDFRSGPSTLPVEVLGGAREQLVADRGTGMSLERSGEAHG